MFKIQTLSRIAEKGLDLLSRDNYDVANDINNPDAILVRSTKMHDMKTDNSLKAIARAGAGVNNIPVDKCTEKGVVVFNTPGANANGVKELVIAAFLLSSRNIIPAVEWANSLIGKGDEVPALIEKGKKNFVGTEISGKKLGVIGLGAIGTLVANAAEELGMNVMGYDPFISVDSAWNLYKSVTRAKSLDTLLEECDFITLNLALTEKTKGMINAEKFSIMKKGVRIVNMARGGLIDTKALKEAIDNGIVENFVTDFPDEELLKMDKVIGIPHLGASTIESEENCAVMAVKQVKNFLEKGNIINSVNYPECEMEFTSDTRIVIANKNIPKMVNQITTILAEHQINISEMINRNKGDYAYNIIDVEKQLPEEVINKLNGIEGVIMVRIINK